MPLQTRTTSSNAGSVHFATRQPQKKRFTPDVISVFIALLSWAIVLVLAIVQAWSFRFTTTVDGIAYLDMSDFTFGGSGWHRLIDGVWSPLYPMVLGISRRLISGAGEIQNAHYIDIGILIFAFLCFEVLRRTIKTVTPGLWVSGWVFDVIAYAVFLWASISAVTLRMIRPDMLMSGFLYLAGSLVLKIRARGGSWTNYILLGVVLGIGYLAKAPMLYIGLALIGCTLNTRSFKETALKAAAAGAILLAVGSLYFMPLSSKVGHFTLGQSSEYNYLGHIDQIGMYQETLGHAAGRFSNPPRVLFHHPPVYSFDTGEAVTFPLRFEPARWVAGARPQFYLPSEIAIIKQNAKIYETLLAQLSGVIAGILLFGFLSSHGFRSTLVNWPLAVAGVAGLGMYLLVHVEERYVGAFFLLLCLGLISGPCATSRFPEKISGLLAGVIALALLLEVAWGVRLDYRRYRQQPTNAWVAAAQELSAKGIRPGAKVARICDRFADLNWARQLRATVVSEVQFDRSDEFWSATPDVQDHALRAIAESGAVAVIAHRRAEKPLPQSWQKLGKTAYYYQDLTAFRTR
jgi:hypothetical protein